VPIAITVALLATGFLLFLILRGSKKQILLIFTLIVAVVSWLVAGTIWLTNRWSASFSLNLPDLKFLLFAILVTAAIITTGRLLGKKKGMQTVGIVMAAVWLAFGMGWLVGEWSGILAITMPSLLIMAAGLLALPSFVLPVAPLPWRWPTLVAMVYTLLWLVGLWTGWLTMDIINFLVYLQGLLLILRPAFPLQTVTALIPLALFTLYGLFALVTWRVFHGFELDTVNLLILTEGLLVLSCYTLPVTGKTLGWAAGLSLFYWFALILAMSVGRIEGSVTNLFILFLGVAALDRFIISSPREVERKIGVLTVQWITVLVLFTLFLLVWASGLISHKLQLSGSSALPLAIGSVAIFLPVFVKPSKNWEAFKAIITFNLGTNYPYQAVKGGKLATRAAGNPFAQVFSGPGIVLTDADYAVVIYRGGSFNRVAPPGVDFTYAFETVREIVDLRPQLRATPPIIAKTKDGIEVSVIAFTPFRLDIDRPVAITSSGYRALVGDHDGILQVWNLLMWNEEWTQPGHQDLVRALAVVPNSNLAVSVSADSTLKVWNLVTRQQEIVYRHDDFASARALAVMSDGHRAVIGSANGTVTVWDLHSGKRQILLDYSSNEKWVYAVAASSNAERIVMASSDGLLRVWDTLNGRAERNISCEEDWIDALALTPNGQHAVSASSQGTLQVWNLDNGEQERVLAETQRGVRAVAVMSDNRHALFCFSDGAVKEWDIATGQQMPSSMGPENWKRALGHPVPELGRSFPYNPKAINMAVHAQLIAQETDQKLGWDKLMRQACEQVLRDIIAEYTLDELSSLERPDRNPRAEIAARMRRGIKARLYRQDWGILLIGGGISNLEPPAEAVQERIEHWKAHWESDIVETEAKADATERQMIEKVWAEAQRELLRNITAGLDRMASLPPSDASKLMALSLLEALDRAGSADPIIGQVVSSSIQTVSRLLAQGAPGPNGLGGEK
jgi:WD40 repeat protein